MLPSTLIALLAAITAGEAAVVAEPRSLRLLSRPRCSGPDARTPKQWQDTFDTTLEPIPVGYSRVFTNLKAASHGVNGYMGYSVVQRTGGTQECAKRCNDKKGCSSFNLYFERAPAVNPTVACPNPLSKTILKCVYYRSPVSLRTATNNGQWRRKFQVLIAGSSGYAACTTSQYWDSATRACTEFPTCSPDTQWLNKEMGTCVDFPICDPDTQWFDRNTKSCIDYPVCSVDTHFLNKEMKECVAFPSCNTESEYLDKAARECVAYAYCDPVTHFLNKEKNECVAYPSCDTDSEFLDKTARECVTYAYCNPDTDFLNKEKNECVSFPSCDPKSEYLDKTAGACVAHHCDLDTHWPNAFHLCIPYPICSTTEVLNKQKRVCECVAINLIENPGFEEKVGWTTSRSQIGLIEITNFVGGWTLSGHGLLFASFFSHMLTPLTMKTQQSLSNLVIGRRYDLTVPIAMGAWQSGGAICTVQIQFDSEPLGDAYTVGKRPAGNYEPVERTFTAKASTHDLQLIYTCSGQTSAIDFPFWWTTSSYETPPASPRSARNPSRTVRVKWY